MDERYKLYYHGDTTNRNGIGIVFSKKWRDNVLNINRITDRITDEDKDTFWKKLDEGLQSIPANEKVILAGDINGHVGADRSGVERWHRGHGYGSQNEEGRTILQCAEMYDLAIANTFFEKMTNI